MNKILAAAIAFLMDAPVLAAQPRSVDARALDIAESERAWVWNAAKRLLPRILGWAHLQLKPAFIESSACRQVAGDFLWKEGEKLIVNFEASLSFGAKPGGGIDVPPSVVATHIRYVLPYSAANVQSLAKAALVKYGLPSNAPLKTSMEWCAKPEGGCSPNNKAMLSLSGTELALFDVSLIDARFDAESERRAASPQ